MRARAGSPGRRTTKAKPPGGLSKEVRYWGNWILERVKSEIADLYPPIPDPKAQKVKQPLGQPQLEMAGEGFERKGQQKLAVDTPTGYLTPVTYLWTRTVRCKNPACGATVALVRQTWLCKKKGRYVALKMVVPKGKKEVRFDVVNAPSEQALGFDPAAFSQGGNATCPFCGTVADNDYVQSQGRTKQVGAQLMAVVCGQNSRNGKTYVSASELSDQCIAPAQSIALRLDRLSTNTGFTPPKESINPLRPSPWTRGASGVTRHGLATWGDLFAPRQMLCLLTFASAVREVEKEFSEKDYQLGQAIAIQANLALWVDRLADYNSTLCSWHNTRELIGHTYGRPAVPMVWDYTEVNPFGGGSGSPEGALDWICGYICKEVLSDRPAIVKRGSSTNLASADSTFDAVITDPPYYDNVPYADISDFFYVWLKRTVGHVYPEHFATELTPKKTEATALASRHGGNMAKANAEYESMMLASFREAFRVLKDDGQIVVVYAHKTTLGWATLVDAIRRAGFMVTEAWPLDTEMGARLLAMESAALASSIFLVARKRKGASVGSYEEEVQSELERIVLERVETLWEMGISGADLVIACVGAGLRAFTRVARVDYANGEEVPAQRFLTEVETVVLQAILARLSREVAAKAGKYDLASVDPATRL